MDGDTQAWGNWSFLPQPLALDHTYSPNFITQVPAHCVQLRPQALVQHDAPSGPSCASHCPEACEPQTGVVGPCLHLRDPAGPITSMATSEVVLGKGALV